MRTEGGRTDLLMRSLEKSFEGSFFPWFGSEEEEVPVLRVVVREDALRLAFPLLPFSHVVAIQLDLLFEQGEVESCPQ